ncbi:MAG TPA: laccase domain-containing protein, partial [Chthoniobacterales bacterium]
MTAPGCRIEGFSALAALSFIRAAFLGHSAGVDVRTDRATALARLAGPHRQAAESAGFSFSRLATAEQIHGAGVALAETPGHYEGVDGLITAQPGLPLGIYVADCAAVYLADRRSQAIGLVHSGKKGTELGIVPAAIRAMETHFGTRPADLTVQVSPCIRPP